MRSQDGRPRASKFQEYLPRIHRSRIVRWDHIVELSGQRMASMWLSFATARNTVVAEPFRERWTIGLIPKGMMESV
jgi:hypothetical protein